MTLEERIVEAAERGTSAGRNNALVVTDCISSSGFTVLLNRGEVDCPEWLSGEYAGQSIQELLGDLIDEDAEDVGEQSEALCDAYEEAASDEFWSVCHKYAQRHR